MQCSKLAVQPVLQELVKNNVHLSCMKLEFNFNGKWVFLIGGNPFSELLPALSTVCTKSEYILALIALSFPILIFSVLHTFVALC